MFPGPELMRMDLLQDTFAPGIIQTGKKTADLGVGSGACDGVRGYAILAGLRMIGNEN